MEQLFNETAKLISGQTETTGKSMISFQDLRWVSTSLWHSRAYQYSNAKAYVFSDSVLSVGKMGDGPIATWKNKMKWSSENNHVKDMNRIDVMPTEFEWKKFPGIITFGLLEKIQDLMRDLQCEPEHFNDRIIFMSMYNDTAWRARGIKERCEYNSQTVANYARRFPRGHWSFLEPGSEKKWYGTYYDKPDGSWDRNFSESGHPISRVSSAFVREELRSKEHGKRSIRFNGSEKTSSCFSAR